MSNTLIYGLNPDLEVISIKTDLQGKLLLSDTSNLNVSVSQLFNLETTQQQIKTELTNINNKTIHSHRLTDTDYFSGTLNANDNTNVIDLGTRTNIQFGGKSTTSNFSFVIEYSSDNINFSSDGFQPELTLVGTEYRFNLTRTNVCMRFVRLLCINTGENVVIQVSAIQ